MHSSFSSLSVFLQYTLLAGVAYVLAGAPLFSVITSYSGTTPRYANAGTITSLEKLQSLVVPEADLVCQEHSHRGVFVLSREPLVIYIEGFLSDVEAKEVVKIRYVRRYKKCVAYC